MATLHIWTSFNRFTFYFGPFVCVLCAIDLEKLDLNESKRAYLL